MLNLTASIPPTNPPSLTESEIAELREAVVSRKPSGDEWWHLLDGPLGGIRVRISASDANCHCIGWCTVTRHGPVQAMYHRDGDVLVFRDLM